MSEMDLEMMIRNARPALSAEERERLDDRIAEIPSRGWLSRAKSGWARPRRVAMSAAAAALLIVISPPLVASLQTNPIQTETVATSELKAAQADRMSAPDAIAEGEIGGAIEPIPAPAPPDDLSGPREIERSASLSLTSESVAESSSEAIRIASSSDGVVTSAQTQSGGEADEWAQIEMMIPSDQLDAVVARLSSLGDVSSLQTSALDITSQFNPIKDQLREIRAERSSLLGELESASSFKEREELKAQLDALREREGAIRDQLDQLKTRAEYARVSLSIKPPSEEKASRDESFSPEQAINWWAEAAGPISGVLVLLLIPALISALAFFAARALSRRKR